MASDNIHFEPPFQCNASTIFSHKKLYSIVARDWRWLGRGSGWRSPNNKAEESTIMYLLGQYSIADTISIF